MFAQATAIISAVAAAIAALFALRAAWLCSKLEKSLHSLLPSEEDPFTNWEHLD